MKKRKKAPVNIVIESPFSRPTVLGYLTENKLKFFKVLKKTYKSELGFSRTLPIWAKKGFVVRVKEIRELNLLPVEKQQIINIVKALDKYFPPDGKYSYGNKTAVETAVVIQKLYGSKITHYMKKYLFKKDSDYLSKHGPEEALKEQIKRGFKHRSKVKIDTSKPYIRSLVDMEYVWPTQYDVNQVHEKFENIAVGGYTQIKMPKRFKK